MTDGQVTEATKVAVERDKRPISELPSAAKRWDEIAAKELAGAPIAAFFDYDGTLTPIVDRPKDALLDWAMRARLDRLAHCAPTGIVSGRDVGFVVESVGLAAVLYLGSHGFEVVPPEGVELQQEQMRDFESYLPGLDAAERDLRERVREMPGVEVERKRFAIAVHYRRAPEGTEADVERMAHESAASTDGLKVTGGKKIFELRPDVDWNKGRAIRWALGALGLDTSSVRLVFIGDDLTDEDVFDEFAEEGITIVVGEGERPTSARYSLPNTNAVSLLLENLADYACG